MAPMHRLAGTLLRTRAATAAPSSTISRLAALRTYATGNGKGTDTTNASGQPRDNAQVKNHEDAQKGHDNAETMSEGNINDRSKSNTRFQDTQTQEATKAREERDHGYSNSGLDAANLSNKKHNTGQAQKQRAANSTNSEEGRKFNPGQGGEQVGGAASNNEPLKKGEGMGSKEEAPSASTLGGLGQFAKNIVGQGPASGKSFHTYNGPLRAKATSTPSEAVDKGARAPKDTGVGAEQSPHLPHHKPGEGDKMPAVKNNAGLPSKGGKTPSDKPSGKRHASTNAGKGPGQDARPTGTASSPGSRAVDPQTGTHSPSWAPESGPSATYEHVTNAPEPSSHKTKYAYSESMPSGAVPSGQAPRSSTSPDAYNSITTSGILKQEAGVGTSNKTHMNNQNEAGEMVEEMMGGKYPGQEGDDAGGRSRAPPPDVASQVGIEIEDTLPKPIKQ